MTTTASPEIPYFATLKYIDNNRNFGWLKPDDGSASVFVRAHEFANLRELTGRNVEVGTTRCKYDIEQTERGPRAVHVRPV